MVFNDLQIVNDNECKKLNFYFQKYNTIQMLYSMNN